MINIPLDSFMKIYFKNKLKFLELTLLSLFLAFLPSLEAPKNIFLAGYLITALYRQYKLPSVKWNIWDWIFLSLITSSFLSALFPFVSGGLEWKGFRSMLFWVIFGWTIARSDYNMEEKKFLFIFAIISVIPPLILGLMDYFLTHLKDTLELHSVGHVNHSAIYLCMMAGASFSVLLNQLQAANKKYVFITAILFIFLVFSVITSQSRAAFGITFFLIFFIILFNKSSLKIKAKLLAFLAIFLLAMSFIKPLPVIKKHMANINNNDVLAHRDKIWNAAFEIAKLNPILGIGQGNWKYIEINEIKDLLESHGETFNAENYALEWQHPHNIYLSNLVDRGILGLIVFLNFMFIWLITLIYSYKKFNQDSRMMLFALGSFSAWMSIFGIGLVNTTFQHENALLALFFLGLHLNYLRQKNQLKLFN